MRSVSVDKHAGYWHIRGEGCSYFAYSEREAAKLAHVAMLPSWLRWLRWVRR